MFGVDDPQGEDDALHGIGPVSGAAQLLPAKISPFTLFFGSHHDNLGNLTNALEDEAPLWMMLLHWLLAIGLQFKHAQFHMEYGRRQSGDSDS